MDQIYEQISARTAGDIYIGVVGPVRTGKSTFIKRFMETMVIPDMENPYKRERARDELPQSGTGRTIMTAEPKFVPEEAAEVSFADGASCRIRLVDCVGYLVEGALGSAEGDTLRMVSTPWKEEAVPLAEAAELGTGRVIRDHSTIGLVITTDGSFTEFPRESYEPVERRVIEELQQIGKPFAVVVNSAEPEAEAAQQICRSLEEQYGISAIAINCLQMEKTDIVAILQHVLMEFPIEEIGFQMPKYINALEPQHRIRCSLYQSVRDLPGNAPKMGNLTRMCATLTENDYVELAQVLRMDLATGKAVIQIVVPSKVFFDLASELSGTPIANEAALIHTLQQGAAIKKEYDHFQGALNQVYQTGYGIVSPSIEDLSLEPPEIVRQGGRYGVKLRASATSIHLMRAEIKAEVNPIVGSEKQSEELVHYLLSEFEEQPEKIWQTNLFGKSLNELVKEELSQKLNRMPEDARGKIRETLEKVINENAGGLICIIL